MASPTIRLLSQLGYKRQLLSPNLTRVTVPGLPFTAFDAYVNPQSWSVLDTLASAGLYAVRNMPNDDAGSILDINNFYGNHIIFPIATKISFNEQLYSNKIVKAPLYFDTKVTHAGKTSLVTDVHMKTESMMLADARNLHCCVDETNKRPLPIPDWLRRNYDQFGDHGEPIKFPSLQKPSQVSSKRRVAIGQVQYTDIGRNFYLTHSNYLKFCIDGVYKGRMSQTKPGICPVPLLMKSAFTWYRQNCYIGDSLHIEYWNDETNATCVDRLRGDTSVYQCILEFYDAENLMGSL